MSAFIAVPTPGNPFAPAVERLEDISRKHDLPAVCYEIATTSAADSKCRIARRFMTEREEEWLIIVDHDVVVPDNLLDLTLRGKDIVGGVYFIFRPNEANLPFPGVFQRAPNGSYLPVPQVYSRTGLVQCDAIVGGALCINRKVLAAVKPAFQNRFDEWGVSTVSEDMDFCMKAQAAGFSIWADFDMPCEHLQRVPFRLLMQRIAKGLER